MSDKENKTNQSSNSSTFRQDSVEQRRANFTLESSGTQPFDDDRMRGKPSNSRKEGSSDESKK